MQTTDTRPATQPAPTSKPPRFTVTNFTDADTLAIQAHLPGEGHTWGPMVMLHASGGACTFQMDFKPKQARQLAARIIECAEYLERFE